MLAATFGYNLFYWRSLIPFSKFFTMTFFFKTISWGFFAVLKNVSNTKKDNVIIKPIDIVEIIYILYSLEYNK